MDLDRALAFAADRPKAVFVTQRRNGRPQLSNVTHSTTDGVTRVSITTDRAKYHNLVREPWAALHVSSDDFWQYVVLEGPVELSDVASAPDDATVGELVDYYRAVNGEHDDWDAYRAAMVSEHRLMARLRADHAYGLLRG